MQIVMQKILQNPSEKNCLNVLSKFVFESKKDTWWQILNFQSIWIVKHALNEIFRSFLTLSIYQERVRLKNKQFNAAILELIYFMINEIEISYKF